jgi:hypothetical protein
MQFNIRFNIKTFGVGVFLKRLPLNANHKTQFNVQLLWFRFNINFNKRVSEYGNKYKQWPN